MGTHDKPAPAAPAASKAPQTTVQADPFKPSVHAQAAHNMSKAAAALTKGTYASDKELADVHHHASHANLVAAIHSFKSGKHDEALKQFGAAIHHATKKTMHQKAGMDKMMAARNPQPTGGPRAGTGRTGVPRL
jgi:hypothetical protein